MDANSNSELKIKHSWEIHDRWKATCKVCKTVRITENHYGKKPTVMYIDLGGKTWLYSNSCLPKPLKPIQTQLNF